MPHFSFGVGLAGGRLGLLGRDVGQGHPGQRGDRGAGGQEAAAAEADRIVLVARHGGDSSKGRCRAAGTAREMGRCSCPIARQGYPAPVGAATIERAAMLARTPSSAIDRLAEPGDNRD